MNKAIMSISLSALTLLTACTSETLKSAMKLPSSEKSQVINGSGDAPRWHLRLSQVNHRTFAMNFTADDSGETQAGQAMLSGDENNVQQYVGRTAEDEIVTIIVDDNSCERGAQTLTHTMTVSFRDQTLRGCATIDLQ